MKKNMGIKIFAGTTFCFLASYLCSLAGGFNKGTETYPVVIAKKYVKQAEVENPVENPVEMTRSFSAANLKEIIVTTVAKDVDFYLSDKNVVEVIYKSDVSFPEFNPEKDIKTEVDGDRLIIKTDERKNLKSLLKVTVSAPKQGKITVNMPKSIVRLILKTVSADIYVPATTLEFAKFETDETDNE